MENLLSALRGAGEATRLRIIALLSKGELTVGEIVQILGQSQPRVSRHLKLMGEAQLLDRFQEGTQVFYRLSNAGIAGALNEALATLIAQANDDTQDLAKLHAIREERAEQAQAYFKANAANWNKIRSLYVAEAEVEEALRHLQGEKPVRRFLDIGTGTGRMLEVFGPQAKEGLGIDVSREMLAIARDALTRRDLDHCHVRLGDMYHLDLADQTQDLILLHLVLHFADEPARAIEEAARVLAPSGQLFVVDFAPHNEEFLREEHAHRRLGFAEGEVSAFGQAAGLVVHPITLLDGGKLRVNIWHFSKA